MAVSTQLGKCVAEVLGVPETSTASHVRNLREAGLLSKTGRGVTAAQMSTRDAAHLLIATAASLNVKDSADTVSIFSKTESRYATPWFARDAGLDSDHGFTDALVALLDLVANHKFRSPSEFDVEVRFFAPRWRAEIETTDPETDLRSIAEYRVPDGPWVKQGRSKKHAPSPDLERQAKFTEITILQVGALIGGRDL
jgi:hypothetical protein